MGKAINIAIILLLFAASPAQAQEPEVKEEPFPEISTATLKIRLDTTKNFVLVDVRTEEEYIEGHIPRAINVPPERTQPVTEYLPEDIEVPLVFYCRGYV